jgi:RNA polymerase sigma-70 factor (ECF subfamily)
MDIQPGRRGIRLPGRRSTKVTDLSRSGDVLRPDPVEGLDPAHEPRSLATHSQGNSRNPTRTDTTNRHIAANNSRTPGRSGAPSRGVPPIPASRAAAAEVTELLALPSAREETVELRAIDEPAPPSVATPTTPAWPSRPAPDDAAAEVWALVERAQAGDAEAFGLIYDRYLDTVFRFIYFRVGNRPLAEDLTADTFLRALKRIGSFTWQGRDLGAWLVTIARNLVADHFKSGRYRLEVTTGDVLDADREDRGPEGSPEVAVLDHITNVALLTAVRQLNPEQQECIVLRFLQGFSVAETAQAMQKNEGAIKALQYRAVRALHRLLPEGFQP